MKTTPVILLLPLLFAFAVSETGNLHSPDLHSPDLHWPISIHIPYCMVFNVQTSGEVSPRIWSCYANVFVFLDRESNQFLKKEIMI